MGGLTAGEFVPGLRRRQPPRILRTTDGERFRALPGGPGVVRGPAGAQRPVGYRAMAVHDGALYVTAGASLTGDGVVLRVRDPAGRAPRFEQVSPPDLAVFELEAFAGRLYAGTGDAEDGYGVWRMGRGARPGWAPVVTGGAGRGAAVTSVVSMEAYRGRLYAGASGWGTSLFPASELIRIAPDGGWDVVAGAERDVGGLRRAPVSGLPDGFGNAYNMHFWRMQAYRGALLLGTNDWSWSLRNVPGLDARIRSEFGFDLWATCDGAAWWAATRDGFGDARDEFGVRTMAATPAGLFVGTTNHVRGAAVYRSRTPPCARGRPRWPVAARAATVRPRQAPVKTALHRGAQQARMAAR